MPDDIPDDTRWKLVMALTAGFAGACWAVQGDLAAVTGLSPGTVGVAMIPLVAAWTLASAKVVLIATERERAKRLIFGGMTAHLSGAKPLPAPPAPDPFCAADCAMVLLRRGREVLLWNVTDRTVRAEIVGDLHAKADALVLAPGDIRPVGLARPPCTSLVVRRDEPGGLSITLAFDLGPNHAQPFPHSTLGTLARQPPAGTDVRRSLLPWRGRFERFALLELKAHGLLGRRVRILYDHGFNHRRFTAGQTGTIGQRHAQAGLSLYDAAVEVPVMLDDDAMGSVGVRWEALAFDGDEPLPATFDNRR